MQAGKVQIHVACMCRLAVRLQSPALAFLHHHEVMGRALLPGSAFLEAAWAARACLTDDVVPSQMLPLLSNITIEAPFALAAKLENKPAAGHPRK